MNVQSSSKVSIEKSYDSYTVSPVIDAGGLPNLAILSTPTYLTFMWWWWWWWWWNAKEARERVDKQRLGLLTSGDYEADRLQTKEKWVNRSSPSNQGKYGLYTTRRTSNLILFLKEIFDQQALHQTVYPSNPMIKQQAQPGVLVPS